MMPIGRRLEEFKTAAAPLLLSLPATLPLAILLPPNAPQLHWAPQVLYEPKNEIEGQDGSF